MLRNLALWCYRRRRTVLATWLLVLVGCVFLSKAVGNAYSQSLRLPGTESQKAADLLDTDFPSHTGDSGQVVVAAADVRDPAFKVVRRSCSTRSRRCPASPKWSARIRLPVRVRSRRTVRSPTRRSTSATASKTSAAPRPIASSRGRPRTGTLGLRVELGGQMFDSNSAPAGTAAIGLLAAVVILLLAFGSVLAMGLPIMTALFGIGIGLAVVAVVRAACSTSRRSRPRSRR